ncbi:hypothetical protein ACFPM7_26200 [Actinokineospora guangxiensis]|uniref:Uncharacterized protein n=1 Tax=Actinokineospora guangxiensis TaxID=1490288 RepID=A0ABW0EUZ0_9PSEU
MFCAIGFHGVALRTVRWELAERLVDERVDVRVVGEDSTGAAVVELRSPAPSAVADAVGRVRRFARAAQARVVVESDHPTAVPGARRSRRGDDPRLGHVRSRDWGRAGPRAAGVLGVGWGALLQLGRRAARQTDPAGKGGPRRGQLRRRRRRVVPMTTPTPDDPAGAPVWENYIVAQLAQAALGAIPRNAPLLGVSADGYDCPSFGAGWWLSVDNSRAIG